jgi:hypothetical protein
LGVEFRSFDVLSAGAWLAVFNGLFRRKNASKVQSEGQIESSKKHATQFHKQKNYTTTMSLLVQSIESTLPLLRATAPTSLRKSAPPIIPALVAAAAAAAAVAVAAAAVLPKRVAAKQPTWDFQFCRATRALTEKERAELPVDGAAATTTTTSALDLPRMFVEDDYSSNNTTFVLSDELIQDILMHCDGPTLNAIAATCHHLRRLLRDAYWWKKKAIAHCGPVTGKHFFGNSSVPRTTPNFHRVAFWHATRFAQPYSMYEASFRLESAALHSKFNDEKCHMQTYRFPLSSNETIKLISAILARRQV